MIFDPARQTPNALIAAYLAGVDALRQAIAGLSADHLRARPIPGTWSTQEVVCHLADSEVLYADRMKRVLVEDRPTLLFADAERYIALLACDARDTQNEVALVGLVRWQMATILRAQPAEAWQRVGLHSKEGERTLAQLLEKAIAHLEHHLTFVRAKRAAL